LVVVGVQLITLTLLTLRVMVVPVVVVPVVELQMEIMVVKEVRGRRDKVTMVRDREITGTPVVVVVRVKRGMVETVPVVLIPHHTAVMVNSQQ
tara:strand:+ start:382 stop:660 length:279 start_codon:yes stop_codon:yes gene_type:complete